MNQVRLFRSTRNNAPLLLLMAVSVIVRAVLAGWVELGTDEAYYWTFAKYPDWSHFDHPGMVGWLIQLFTLNLRCDGELFMRMASLVFMTANTYMMYRIGRELKDESTGLWAALLYTASIYAFVITGVFILPDTPLCFFGLMAFWCLLRSNLLLASLFIGLAILSKYTGAFLWVGFLLYVVCFDRKQLRNPRLYLSLLITAVCCLPIVVWNAQNDWVSFRFHGDRVGLTGALNPGSFDTELAGEFFYNNPVNFVIAIITVVAAFRKKLPVADAPRRLILLTALPMIGLFWLFSLTRPTLPHWSAPAFVLLIPLSAVWLSTLSLGRARAWVISAMSLLALTLVVGVAEIKTGFVPLDHHTEPTELGRDDITLDLYGWRQAGEKFAEIRAQEIAKGEMRADDAIIGHKWFPMASLQYYAARPLGLDMLGYGPLELVHKYQWINEETGGFERGRDYWYLDDSHHFIDPEKAYAYGNFKRIRQVGVIPIERCGRTVRNIYVYECKGLVYGPE